MSTEHSSYEQIARKRRSTANYREGYDEARRAFLIGQAVRERRLALGLSQTEVAARAGMTPTRPFPPRSRRRRTHHSRPRPNRHSPRSRTRPDHRATRSVSRTRNRGVPTIKAIPRMSH